MAKRTRWSTMKKDTISFEKPRQQFTVYNKTVGKSARTVAWYEQKLELFERYLGPDACLADVTIPNVRGFIAELQERTQGNPNNPPLEWKDRSRRPTSMASCADCEPSRLG